MNFAHKYTFIIMSWLFCFLSALVVIFLYMHIIIEFLFIYCISVIYIYIFFYFYRHIHTQRPNYSNPPAHARRVKECHFLEDHPSLHGYDKVLNGEYDGSKKYLRDSILNDEWKLMIESAEKHRICCTYCF